MAVPAHLSRDEIRETSRDLPPTSADDVPVTTDGVRLDTEEKVLAFLAQLERERQVGSSADHRPQTAGSIGSRSPSASTGMVSST